MTVKISTTEGMKEVEVNEFITIGGKKCFVHKEKWDPQHGEGFTWKVSEYTSGLFFGMASTKKRAIDEAKSMVRLYGVGRFHEQIEKNTQKHGIANP